MSDIGLLVIVVAIIFLSLSAFITLFVINYQRRQLRFKKETEALKMSFQQELLRAQLEMQEQTFSVISQEIHDNVGQSLSLATVQLHLLNQSETLNKSIIQEIKASINRALTDLRDIAKNLQSERIQQYSLPEIIEQELLRINRSRLLVATLELNGNERDIADQKKLILFRIIQEILQNVIKHANAKNVIVNCQYCENILFVTVSDDGKGFMPESIKRNDGLGLLNIMNRIKLIGGEVQISSVIDTGTTIKISTPYV